MTLATPPSLAGELADALEPASILRHAGIPAQPWQLQVLREWRSDWLLLCSRHAGKSTVGAAMGLHAALTWPGHPVVLVGRAGRQSSEIFRKAKELYLKLPNPPRLVSDAATVMELETGSRLLPLPGAEESIRGISAASAVVIDEAGYVDDSMLTALEPMLSTTGGPLWCMTTAAGRRGWFFDYFTGEVEGFKRMKVTANECPHISREFLEKRRKRWPKWKFQQEFECEFVADNEAVFTNELMSKMFSEQVTSLCL
jgi:hypothetical protein